MRVPPPIRSAAPPVLLAGAVLLLAACDPCAGLSVCGEPRMEAEGRVHVAYSGAPADGVRVIVEPREPGGFEPFETLTDDDGWFRVVQPTDDLNPVPVRLVFVHPAWPDLPHGVETHIPVTRVEGATRYIGAWVVGPHSADPHIRAGGRVFREISGDGAYQVEVTFERTGGRRIDPPVVTTLSNAAGRFRIEAQAERSGTVIGRLTLAPGPPYALQIFEDVEIPVFTAYPLEHQLGEWPIDHHLRYAGELQWGDGEPVVGAEVTFRRTGGIPVEPEVDVMITGGDGRFWFSIRAHALGTVEGELTAFLPGAEEPTSLGQVELETFAGDPRLFDIWWVERH